MTNRSMGAAWEFPVALTHVETHRILNTNLHRITTAISRGEEAAFREFYERYKCRMHGYLFVMARGDSHLADEAFQDSMLRVVRYLRPFEHEDVLWAWLVRLMKSAFIDQIRRRRQPNIVQFPIEELSVETDVAEASELEFQDLLHTRLGHAMQALDPDERTLLEAHYFDGVPQKELAEMHRMSSKAVGMRFARIRRKLKSLMEGSLRYE